MQSDWELKLIWIYLIVLEAVKQATLWSVMRTRGVINPEFTDAEAIALVLYCEMEGYHEDAEIWRYAHRHLRHLFPDLPNEYNFSRRLANLSGVMKWMQEKLFAPTGNWNAFDGLPMPVCKYVRGGRDKCFAGEATWGYCATKKEYYYGFKIGALMNSAGEIFSYWLGPSNVDEREMLSSLAKNLSDTTIIADKGMISEDLKNLLAGQGVNLYTPLRKNMKDDRPVKEVRKAMRLRRRIETAFSVCVDFFKINLTRGRDIWRYSTRVLRKILAYNFSRRFLALCKAQVQA